MINPQNKIQLAKDYNSLNAQLAEIEASLTRSTSQPERSQLNEQHGIKNAQLSKIQASLYKVMAAEADI